ncbi:hypothetical protein GW17_00055978 [Ensete ventricosum]|nr:hypothetical protein GW17_00055978 [Ensete ventricosum]
MASPAFWVAHLEIILVFYAGMGEVIHDLHPLAVVGVEATAEAVVIGVCNLNVFFTSRSRSPAPRRDGRNTEREDRRSRSPRSRSPPPPSKGRKHSLSPDSSKSPRGSRSPSPEERREVEHNGSDSNRRPMRENRRSTTSQDRENSPVGDRYRSPEPNGRSLSPKDDGDDDRHASPGGRESQE